MIAHDNGIAHDDELVSFAGGILALTIAGSMVALGVHSIINDNTILVFAAFSVAGAALGTGLVKLIHAALQAFLPYRVRENAEKSIKEVTGKSD